MNPGLFLFHESRSVVTMIEIFKTDIPHKLAGKQILMSIRRHWPGIVATLDLDDCDKVLRVVGAWEPVPVEEILNFVRSQGYQCEIMED